MTIEIGDEINPVTLTLEAIPKSRGITPDELFAKYTRLCNKYTVLPLWGQMQTALKTLYKQGKIKPSEDRKTVRKL